MSTISHITHLLPDYLDEALSDDARQIVMRHLAICPACRAEYDEQRELLEKIAALPAEITPSRELWSGIEERIDKLPAPRTEPVPAKDRAQAVSSARSTPRRLARGWPARIVFALLLGSCAVWLYGRFSEPAWDVVALEGSPRVGEASLAENGRLLEGQWIETDASSRALLDVGTIGQVEVAPDTRLQLRKALSTDHRLVLEEGRIEALIWAPPRLFFVETPSALAIDLGCAYTLTVDSTGTSLLHVTSGYVELEHGDRASVVPAGAMCMARPGQGPGTTFDDEASQALREALTRYDFEGGGPAALSEVLAEASATDAITLWQLFLQADEKERARVYDRLAELVAPPAGANREGMLRHDPEMIDEWQFHLGLQIMKLGSVKKKRKVLSGE